MLVPVLVIDQIQHTILHYIVCVVCIIIMQSTVLEVERCASLRLHTTEVRLDTRTHAGMLDCAEVSFQIHAGH